MERDQPKTESLPLFTKGSEVVPSLLIVGVLVVLLIPLPSFLIDMLLALNLGLTLLVLLITLNAKKPLDFSVFPGLLLLLTLFRLSLNVATTRQILVNAEAGFIVETFGRFVVAGSLVVGLVIFLILIIVQFVVITKGASRISEVSARFVLDALPGKQMAIDAELNSGAISDQEAIKKREQLMRETEFYGAMDGASKFVRGDAVAGIIITGINLLGGVIIGMMHDMPLSQAAQTYSVLSIGDGLVSQIPALIIATASGILVTKATSQASLGEEIGEQVTAQPRPLLVGAMIMGALALIPGLPKVPFLFLAAVLWYGGQRLLVPPDSEDASESEDSQAPESASLPAELPPAEFLQMDRAAVELGAGLISLIEPRRGMGLVDHIATLRRDLARRHGLWVPPIRIRSDLSVPSNEYRIQVVGQEVARGVLAPGKWLAISPDGSSPSTLEGEPTNDPTFQLPALWITEANRQRAELSGHTVVDAPTVLMTHLGEIVKRHAHELLSREDLAKLVDQVRELSPSVVDELIPTQLTMGALHRIVCLLLEERVPITHLAKILESLSQHISYSKDSFSLADRCRVDLGRAICEPFRDSGGKIFVIALEPRLEMELRHSMQEGMILIDSARLEKLLVSIATEWKKAAAQGLNVALLTHVQLRRSLRQLIISTIPDLPVLAYEEIPRDLNPQPFALIQSGNVAQQ